MRPIKAIAVASPKPLMMSTPRSQWHSPVPYRFGGLSAMLALIAFALLILACSYRAVSARLDNNNGGGGGGDDTEDDSNNQVKVYEDQILVIMAGELTPTFLATPVFSKASIFGDQNGDSKDMRGSAENDEKIKQEMDDDHHQSPTITHNHERQQ